jgi:hypothetical protein
MMGKEHFVALEFTCPMTQKSLNLVAKTRGKKSELLIKKIKAN